MYVYKEKKLMVEITKRLNMKRLENKRKIEIKITFKHKEDIKDAVRSKLIKFQ